MSSIHKNAATPVHCQPPRSADTEHPSPPRNTSTPPTHHPSRNGGRERARRGGGSTDRLDILGPQVSSPAKSDDREGVLRQKIRKKCSSVQGAGSDGRGIVKKHPKSAPVDEFDDPRIVLMLKQVSEDAPSKLGLFRRVYSSTASPREAIRAKCLECDWMDVASIRECTGTACPLFRFRPYQTKAEG